jgi:hypothetical protein
MSNVVGNSDKRTRGKTKNIPNGAWERVTGVTVEMVHGKE